MCAGKQSKIIDHRLLVENIMMFQYRQEEFFDKKTGQEACLTTVWPLAEPRLPYRTFRWCAFSCYTRRRWKGHSRVSPMADTRECCRVPRPSTYRSLETDRQSQQSPYLPTGRFPAYWDTS